MTVGGDAAFADRTISIHIPRVGDDIASLTLGPDYEQFQSTSPVWGMTKWFLCIHKFLQNFNPHPPCGG